MLSILPALEHSLQNTAQVELLRQMTAQFYRLNYLTAENTSTE